MGVWRLESGMWRLEYWVDLVRAILSLVQAHLLAHFGHRGAGDGGGPLGAEAEPRLDLARRGEQGLAALRRLGARWATTASANAGFSSE